MSMARYSHPKCRVCSSLSDVISSCSSDSIREGDIDNEDDEDVEIDEAQLSWFLKSRTHEKENKKRGFEDFSMVLTRRKRCRRSLDVFDQVPAQGFEFTDDRCGVVEEELENESSDVEIFRTGDIVWAKAFPYAWWPGWVCRRDRSKVLVSFFGCDRTRNFHNSELRCFEKNFEAMSKMARQRLSDAIDCALAELGRRLILGLMSPCQGSSKDDVDVDARQQYLIKDVKSKEFQPVIVLGFILRMAVSPWMDNVETVSAIRGGAQVIAFRRYISLKHDYIYRETMIFSDSRLASDDNSEASMNSTYQEKASHSSFYDEKAYSMSQEAEYSDEEQEDIHEAFAKQVKMVSLCCKKNRVKHLREILTHLCCLALDPFYSGAEGSWVESTTCVCQKILTYRALVFHEVLDLVPRKHTSYNGCEVEISKVQVASRLDAASHVGNAAAKTLAEENIGITNGRENQESNVCIQHSNKAGVKGMSEAVKVDCNISMDELSTIDPIVKDAVSHVEHTSICNHEMEMNQVLEVSRLDSVSRIHDAATKTHGDNSDIANDDSYESKILSHALENAVNILPFNNSGTNGRFVNVKVDCNLSCMLKLSPSESVFVDVIGTHSNGRVGVASGSTSRSPLFSHLSDSHFKIQSSDQAAVVANITNKEVSLGIVSENSSKRERRLSKPAASDFSLNIHKAQNSYPQAMLYASPLTPVSSNNARFKSSGTNGRSEYSTSLHMKFPKGFKLPSKAELLKQFQTFGPLDSSKTKVFFYTGSAQVVFLHQLDAEAAYHYAKIKNIFFRQANVRFWLDRHEQRRGTTNIPVPLPFSTVQQSPLNLKSCLKISNSPGKDKRKPHRVKFLPENQTISFTATTTAKEEAFTLSDSCKFSREVEQDISVQMLVLLEKCNQLVCKIKGHLGLQSYYSIFTQNCFHVPKLDDE